jgi:hypothetical protein
MGIVGISKLNDNNSFKYLLVCPSAAGISTGSNPNCGGNVSLTATPGIPVVLFSTGKNGAQAPVSPDEIQNLNPNNVFISHDISADGYDDLVNWLSLNTLLNRMVAAGRLP